MKLDERFKALPICCFVAEKCVKYIGHKGYFSNYIDSFKYINYCKYGTLENVYNEQPDSFEMKEDGKDYKYFIPECFVEPKEKQYRPCTLDEDEFGLNIGDLIKFRRKDDHNFEVGTMYMGYLKNNGIVKVLLGNTYYSLDELFNDYEWFDKDSNKWEIFGVEE